VSSLIVEEAAGLLANPRSYVDEARLNAGLALLREQAPVVWVDHTPYRPFWAVTKHADIFAIERDNDLWINGPHAIMAPAELDDQLDALRDAGMGLRNLVHMDGEYHRVRRAIGAEWFSPKVIRTLRDRVDGLAGRYVNVMADIGPECEFVRDVALAYPAYVILSLLGLPESDFPLLLSWTQELFGLDDDERRRGSDSAGAVAVIEDFVAYFQAVTEDRRANPSDDLASAIANARIDGELFSEMEVISYYQVIAAAGHDTTKATLAGGLLALIANPDQRHRLRDDPTLMPTAVEEIVRWSTPVKVFMRTASRDTVLRGVPIAAGESVCLVFASGNRDAEAFEDPQRFDVGRQPNRHLGFGAGVHFCLGAALARMEIDSFYRHLLPRLRAIELVGEPKFSPTTFVGGLKQLPIRYEMT
jgi:cytochrome P450